MKTLGSKVVLFTMLLSTALAACSRNAGNANSGNMNAGPTATNNAAPASSPVAGNTSSNSAGEPYPQQVADEFLKSCEEAGSESKFCRCVFDKVQERYSFEEFSVIESKLTAGNPPDEFVEFTGRARAQCMK